jgi:hypothetical protein
MNTSHIRFFVFFSLFFFGLVSFWLRFAIVLLSHRQNGSPATAIQFHQLGA